MTVQRAAAPATQPIMLWAGCGVLVILALLDLAGVPVIETLPLPSLLLAIAVLLCGSWLLVSQFARSAPVDLKLLDTGMLTLAAMALLGLVLGTLGILRFSTLMLGAGLIVALGVPLAGRWRAGDPSEFDNLCVDESPPEPTSLRDRLPHWTTLLLAGLTAFAFVQALGGRRFRPPIGDALAYHLPFAVEWLQHGDLGMPVPAAGDPSPPFYPLNSSLWMFWTLAPLEGDVLARFVQAPFLVLLGLAAYRLAREVGARTNAALASAAVSVTLPGVARGASLAENDLILAALLVTATASLARLWREPTLWRAALTALPLGLAAGTKVTALPYAGLLAIALAGVVFWKWKSQRFINPAGIVLVAAGLVVLLGGYSYLRNAVVMDNPLYPSGYVLFGREIFSGIYVMTREWRTSHVFYPFDWSGFFFGSRGSFGYTVTLWVLPGLAATGVALLVAAIRPAKVLLPSRPDVIGASVRRFDAWPALALLLWTGISLAIFWFIIPYHFSRFLYPTIIWGIVAAAWGLETLVDRLPMNDGRKLVPVLALPFVALNVVNVPLDLTIRGNPLYWIAGIVVMGATASVIAVARSLSTTRLRRALVPLVIATAVLASLVWPLYESRYKGQRFEEWRAQTLGVSTVAEAWEWVYRGTEAQPATIAVAGTNEIYPLYGEDLDNRIVTIRPTGEIVRYDWGRRSHVFGAPYQAAWLAALDRAEIDYIYMTEDVSLGGWPQERAWIEAMPDRFTLVFENDDVSIWEIVALE